MEQFSILNSIFNPIYIFKQKLEQLLQHVFEQLFLARTILDSGCLSGTQKVCPKCSKNYLQGAKVTTKCFKSDPQGRKMHSYRSAKVVQVHQKMSAARYQARRTARSAFNNQKHRKQTPWGGRKAAAPLSVEGVFRSAKFLSHPGPWETASFWMFDIYIYIYICICICVYIYINI